MPIHTKNKIRKTWSVKQKAEGNPNISEIIISMNRLEHPTKLQRLSITHVCACAHPHTQCYYFRVSLWDWHSAYHANEAPHRVPFETTQHRKDKKKNTERKISMC